MPISSRMLAHKVTVQRQQAAGGMRTGAATILTDVPASVIPMDRQSAIANGFVPYKAFDMFTNERGIKTGDVIIESGRKFVVKSPNAYNGFGSVDHAHYLLELAA